MNMHFDGSERLVSRRTLAIDRAVDAIERELHHHLDAVQRAAVVAVLELLADDAMTQCRNRHGVCW